MWIHLSGFDAAANVDYLIASFEFPSRWTGARSFPALTMIQDEYGMRVAP